MNFKKFEKYYGRGLDAPQSTDKAWKVAHSDLDPVVLPSVATFTHYLKGVEAGLEANSGGLKELQDRCGEAANKNGWHDDYPQRENYADAFAYEQAVTLWITAKAGLIAAEAHEAIEELRNGNSPHKVYYNGTKPEGFGIELADVIIRVLDLAWVVGIDIEELVVQKLKANELRGTRHGGKVL